MKTSSTGKRLVQAFESCLKRLPDGRFTTYRCPANVITIGWGTTGADVPGLLEGAIWTKTRCDDVFAASLAKYEEAVLKAAGATLLNQNQFDALVSLTYNCGPGAVNGSIGTALRAGRYSDVPALIKRWNKCRGKVLNGLVRRREAEALLFAGDVSGAMRVAGVKTAEPMPQAVDTPKPPVAEAAKSAKAPAAVSFSLLGLLIAAWERMSVFERAGAVLFAAVAIAAAWFWGASKIRKLKEQWA